jgi:hypothetical protein
MASAAHGSVHLGIAEDIRLVVDTIPGLVGSTRSDGSTEIFNQRKAVNSRKTSSPRRAASMTYKIEQLAGGESSVVIRVCGRIQLEHVSTIKDLIGRKKGMVVLDLTEVTLVDREAVNLIAMRAQEC